MTIAALAALACVTVGLDLPPAVAQAAPGTTISGTVRSSTGTPLEGIQVRLYAEPYAASSAVTTGSDGRFSFANRAPGRYKVWYRVVRGTAHRSEYHADRSDLASADPIEVGAEPVVVDAELSSPPPPPVRGTLQGTVTGVDGTPAAGVQVRAYRAPYESSSATTTAGDGTYAFPSLLAGDYKVWFRSPAGSTWVSEYHHDRGDLAAADPVTVAAGATVVDAELDRKATATPNTARVAGTVTSEAGTPIAAVQVRLYPEGSTTGSVATTTAADGSYQFTGRPPGRYQVWFRPLGLPWRGEWFQNASVQPGSAVVVGVNGTTTTVHARLAPAAGGGAMAPRPEGYSPNVDRWTGFGVNQVFSTDNASLTSPQGPPVGATQINQVSSSRTYRHVVSTPRPSSRCGVSEDRRVYCWGGAGEYLSTDATPLPGPEDVRMLRTQQNRSEFGNQSEVTCAVSGDGRAWCWGWRVPRHPSWAGGGATTGVGNWEVTPQLVPGVDDAIDVSIHDPYACVLHSGGDEITCWGDLSRIGFATPSGQVRTETFDAPGTLTQISGGLDLCGVERRSGRAWCRGLMPNVLPPNQQPPAGSWQPVAHLGPIEKIWSPNLRWMTCALSKDGRVSCWGPPNYLYPLLPGGAAQIVSTPLPVVDADHNFLRFSDGTFGWLAQRTPSGIQPVTVTSPIDARFLGPRLPQRVGVIGDSFTSGEGVPASGYGPYRCGTDVEDGVHQGVGGPGPCPAPTVDRNTCHRSTMSAASLLARRLGTRPAELFDISCSGATVANVLVGRQHPESGADGAFASHSQLAWVDDASGGDLDLLIVGVGGNSIYPGGFGALVGRCMLACPGGDDDQLVASGAAFVRASVENIVRDARARFGPSTRILVVGYPTILDPGETCGETFTMGPGSSAWLGTVLDDLNHAVAAGSRAAGAEFLGAAAPGDALGDVLAGHRICDADPWVNGTIFEGLGASNESLHPNGAGHQAMAVAVERYLAGG